MDTQVSFCLCCYTTSARVALLRLLPVDLLFLLAAIGLAFCTLIVGAALVVVLPGIVMLLLLIGTLYFASKGVYHVIMKVYWMSKIVFWITTILMFIFRISKPLKDACGDTCYLNNYPLVAIIVPLVIVFSVHLMWTYTIAKSVFNYKKASAAVKVQSAPPQSLPNNVPGRVYMVSSFTPPPRITKKGSGDSMLLDLRRKLETGQEEALEP